MKISGLVPIYPLNVEAPWPVNGGEDVVSGMRPLPVCWNWLPSDTTYWEQMNTTSLTQPPLVHDGWLCRQVIQGRHTGRHTRPFPGQGTAHGSGWV